VVYLQSGFGAFYAVDAESGAVLATVATGGESSGPAVSRGQVYLGTGTTEKNPGIGRGDSHPFFALTSRR